MILPEPLYRPQSLEEAWDRPRRAQAPSPERLEELLKKYAPPPVAPHLVESQGMKFDTDKPKWSLLPKGTIAAVVRVLTFGAKKYAPDNWKKIDPERYYDALQRHVEAHRNGEQFDPETKEHHLAHAVCCLLFMLWLDTNKQSEF